MATNDMHCQRVFKRFINEGFFRSIIARLKVIILKIFLKHCFRVKLIKSYNILIGNEYMNYLLNTGRLGSIGSLFEII